MPDTLHDTQNLGDGLSVAKAQNGKHLTVVVGVKTEADCVLHWGLSRHADGAWQRPPDAFWPRGSTPADGSALRTPFERRTAGEREVRIELDLPCPWKNLPFVLHFPRENRWLNKGGKNFSVPLPASSPGPLQALERWAPGDALLRQEWTLDSGDRLAAVVQPTADGVHVHLACDAPLPLMLHWGLATRFRHDWHLPPDALRPAGSAVVEQAVRSSFTAREGLSSLEIVIPASAGPLPRALRLVLLDPSEQRWLKSSGKDLWLELGSATPDPRLGSARLLDLAETIVGAEMGASSWSLMHRFNLCHDLLGSAENDDDGLALLYAWLRFSALRQLDWQRRFNTKPRELSHAQERLTLRIADLWQRTPAATDGAGGRRTWLRLMLTTLGRGGDGQRVRDEILHIMHRHHLKEVSGHFIEEWHQKLHNNTTPDDIVICEAYLAFLRAGGKLDAFDKTLQAGGVTRARLQSFERPIRTNPDFRADLAPALIGEFENFLRILKSVHAGSDLDTAVSAARPRVSPSLGKELDRVLGLRKKGSAREISPAVVEARAGIAQALGAAKDAAAVRDLLYLDLGLEDALRAALERQDLSRADRDTLVDLLAQASRNLALTATSRELDLSAAHWKTLASQKREGRDWALHAKSVADRIGRCVHTYVDAICSRLQPRAEFLGEAFRAEGWTIPLFSEEVVRGGPAFALSLVLRSLDPVLRQAAGLGGWQVISPTSASGRVRVIDRLDRVQAENFAEPTVLIADTVTGNEEIPAGVRGVVTMDTPDLVSHLAVRARNAGVLFATCYEPELYSRLKDMHDRQVTLQVSPGGAVRFEEGGSAETFELMRSAAPLARTPVPFTRWVVTEDEFKPGLVGGKSNNLGGLRGRLPEWIRLPASLALPFGACEQTLAAPENRDIQAETAGLVKNAQGSLEALPRLRALYERLAEPAGLRVAFEEAARSVGLPAPEWVRAWAAIRRVWASKWNERAVLSRRAQGVPDDHLQMAVLVQQVVEADYAFVIHTANPMTGNRDEIFAEVVLGLGETLVGNYPGRALGFVCRKSDLQLQLLSYPAKSVGLYGKGVIFRSDSNGEDLEGFAGAGLYDSFLAEEPRQSLLDYSNEKLVWDASFRDGLLRAIATIGLEVERTLGTPQDIEGAVAGGQYYVVQTRPQVGLK